MLQRKSIAPDGLKFDTDGEGSFRAVFSRFNVVDLDGDVTLVGAFERGQKVRLAQWGHNWQGPAIGAGVIDYDDTAAWVDGQFNLAMQAGRETYESVKFSEELQEYSYGYDILENSFGEWEGREVQFLRRLKVHEVCPVMLGAGIGTGTEWVKSLSAHGKTLADHRAALLDGARDLVSRYEALAASDEKEGRTISTARREQMGEIADGLESSASSLRTILTQTEPKDAPASIDAELVASLKRESGRFLAYQARRVGVFVNHEGVPNG